MICSPYLLRRRRSFAEALAERREPHARLREVQDSLARAETESRKIADEFSLSSPVAECFYDLADAIEEVHADYLKPAADELEEAEG
jgi:hypothetical protein